MKKLTLFLIALMLVAASAFANTQIYDDGTSQGNVDKLDFSTGIKAVRTGSKATISFLATTCALRPASGAAAGSIVSLTDANHSSDCGTAGGGSTFNVCVSNGTNWVDL